MEAKRLYRDLLWAFAAALVLLCAFILLSQSLTSGWLGGLDDGMGEAVRSIRSDKLTPVVIFITWLGKGSIEFILFVIVGAILFFVWKHRWETLVLFLGVLGAWGMNTLIKGLVERERPLHALRLVEEDGFSFPSGHAMVSSLFYGLIGYLLWMNLRHVWKPAWIIPWLTLLLILLIGFSRIYLGVHYPSDVLAGFAAGGAFLAGCIMALHTIRYHRTKRIKG